ncbi:MAG: hypothetical protein B6U73_00385 [Desulfurococcales archaeon ex4484_204]|nr:MAG: hypothetical protein B6U73_00385 [Desulfurococcales archaeon ex4484_204]
MRAEGHIGLSLLVIFGIYTVFQVRSTEMLELGILITAFSTLPDIDIRLEIAHRKYTHNVTAAIVFGVLMGLLLHHAGVGFMKGFIAGFGGTLLHILGDIPTYMKFKPLAPFSQARVGLGLFKASNPAVNRSFLLIGAMTFILYLVIIYVGII